MDWTALWMVEGSCRPDQVGVTGDLGVCQISRPVWNEFARSGEKWWVKADNLKVAARIMDDRRIRYKPVQKPAGGVLGYENDKRDALLWRCPARRNHPTEQDRLFATRYANLCEANRTKAEKQSKPAL